MFPIFCSLLYSQHRSYRIIQSQASVDGEGYCYKYSCEQTTYTAGGEHWRENNNTYKEICRGSTHWTTSPGVNFICHLLISL
jgi:hypothetical protein